MKLPDNWKSWMKKASVGTMIFFIVKGIITTSLIVAGASMGFKGCG